MKAIVLRAAGTNCDYETEFALAKAGFETEAIHVNKLIHGEVKFSDYNLLAIPGGFSHGDYLGSGKVFANKLAYKLNGEVPSFIEQGGLVIGICNGFQVLVKAGLLPGFDGNYKKQDVTLTFNDSGVFQCEWIELENANKGKCIFTKGISKLRVPIAHGEGKFVPKDGAVMQRLKDNDQIVFKYSENPNGSVESVAGICDETGRVFGLMPHPERNLFGYNDPQSTRKEFPEEGAGFAIFRNAAEYLKSKQ